MNEEAILFIYKKLFKFRVNTVSEILDKLQKASEGGSATAGGPAGLAPAAPSRSRGCCLRG